MRIARGGALLALSLSVAACDTSVDTAPGAVSEGEARALEEAAEMLDQRRLPDEAVPDLDAAPSPTPSAEVTGDTGQ